MSIKVNITNIKAGHTKMNVVDLSSMAERESSRRRTEYLNELREAEIKRLSQKIDPSDEELAELAALLEEDWTNPGCLKPERLPAPPKEEP